VFSGYASVDDLSEDIAQEQQGGGKPGLIAFQRFEETIGVPGISDGLRGEVGEPRLGELVCQGQDIFGGRAAPVHHEHGSLSALERLTGGTDQLT